jgi:hypothetical protein
MISLKDGMIYIYKLRQNMNLIRFFKTFQLQIIQNIVVGGYGDTLGINSIKSSGLKRVYISKSILRTINKRYQV